ncbi:hypothetical protein Dimus_037445, partial [Dionaea muscipula]
MVFARADRQSPASVKLATGSSQECGRISSKCEEEFSFPGGVSTAEQRFSPGFSLRWAFSRQ